MGDGIKESKYVRIPHSQEIRAISRPLHEDSDEFASIVTKAVSAIEAAAAKGELECELSVEAGFDWKLADILSQCGFEVRRARRGTVSVSWA